MTTIDFTPVRALAAEVQTIWLESLAAMRHAHEERMRLDAKAKAIAKYEYTIVNWGTRQDPRGVWGCLSKLIIKHLQACLDQAGINLQHQKPYPPLELPEIRDYDCEFDDFFLIELDAAASTSVVDMLERELSVYTPERTAAAERAAIAGTIRSVLMRRGEMRPIPVSGGVQFETYISQHGRNWQLPAGNVRSFENLVRAIQTISDREDGQLDLASLQSGVNCLWNCTCHGYSSRQRIIFGGDIHITLFKDCAKIFLSDRASELVQVFLATEDEAREARLTA